MSGVPFLRTLLKSRPQALGRQESLFIHLGISSVCQEWGTWWVLRTHLRKRKTKLFSLMLSQAWNSGLNAPFVKKPIHRLLVIQQIVTEPFSWHNNGPPKMFMF